MKPVLFASIRPLERAENIRALYDKWDGRKEFIRMNGCRRHPAIRSGGYDLMVIDEFPAETPGKCIMIWHAIQGGKTIGLNQPGGYYEASQASMMDYIVTGGTGSVGMFARCSGLPEEKILPLGLPRTDAYPGKKKGDGGTALAGKRAYLYAPTFRAGSDTPRPNPDWEWLDGELTDEEVLVVKTHPVMRNILHENYRHIIEIPSSEPSAPYLMDCDAVITDYSSIMFDGYLLGKPAILLEKAEGYTRTRGMYMEYPEEYSSRYCTDEREMLRLCRAAKGLTETEKACVRRVADACDGHAAERVCGLIRRMLNA